MPYHRRRWNRCSWALRNGRRSRSSDNLVVHRHVAWWLGVRVSVHVMFGKWFPCFLSWWWNTTSIPLRVQRVQRVQTPTSCAVAKNENHVQKCWTWPHGTTTDKSTHKRMAPAATDY